MRPLISKLKVISVLAISTLVTLLLLEAMLRMMPGLNQVAHLKYYNPKLRSEIAARVGLLKASDTRLVSRTDDGEPRRLWRFKPFAIQGMNTMDSAGFCNPPRLDYEKKSKFHMLALGDSFTYCWNVPIERAWPMQLGHALSIKTYSLGIPTTGVYEYLQMLENFGVEKEPDIVLMTYYSGNDLRDALKYHLYRNRTVKVNGDEPAATQAKYSLPRRIYYGLREGVLGRHSYLLNFLLVRTGLLYSNMAQKNEQTQFDFRYVLEFPDSTVDFNTHNADHDEVVHARMLRSGELSLDILNQALEVYSRLAESHGFVPVISYMPSAHTVYDEFVKFSDPGLSGLMHDFHEKQRNYLENKSNQLGIRFVDMTASLREKARELGPNNLLYRQQDLHLTELGHDVVSKLMASYLKGSVESR